MRTTQEISTIEKDIYTAFCHQHHILNDESPAGIKNGEHIGGYIALWDVDISEDTLKVALEKLSDQLVLIPAEQTEVVDILTFWHISIRARETSSQRGSLTSTV
jgi:hypothetical protein